MVKSNLAPEYIKMALERSSGFQFECSKRKFDCDSPELIAAIAQEAFMRKSEVFIGLKIAKI